MGYRGDNTTGFQSPAQDFIEPLIDLMALLDLGRPGRYPVRVKGAALSGRGIEDGDILVADAAAPPRAGHVCVAMVEGDVLLAVLGRDDGQWFIQPSAGAAVAVGETVEIWAMVTALVRPTL